MCGLTVEVERSASTAVTSVKLWRSRRRYKEGCLSGPIPQKHLADCHKVSYTAHMSTATKTLKLPFLRLNRAKADEFARLQALNTAVANTILALPKRERRTLTSKSFAHIEIGSTWVNQTLRNANARTQVKQFRCLPLQTNNQNWMLHKVGDTYSVAFSLCRGLKK